MALAPNKHAIGVFANRQDAESALNELKNSDFPMDKVSVVARDVSENDEMAESESEFVREQTLKGIGTGAICASQRSTERSRRSQRFAIAPLPYTYRCFQLVDRL